MDHYAHATGDKKRDSRGAANWTGPHPDEGEAKYDREDYLGESPPTAGEAAADQAR